jgi:hypothetical protein
MREIWKSEESKISNPIGLYHIGFEYAFFSKGDDADFTIFVTEADIKNLLERLIAEKKNIKECTNVIK